MMDFIDAALRYRKLRASFVIASYKHTELAIKCINSIWKQELNRDQYEIIVVDDCSPAGTFEDLKEFCETNGVRFYRNPENLGYTKTANRGLLQAIGKAVVLINSDAELLTPCIDRLEADFRQDDRIAVIGCKLVYPNGKIQHAGVQWAAGTPEFYHVNHGKDRYDAIVCKPRYCISVTGAFYAIDSSKLHRTGILNSDYFISFDDSEFSVHCWARGYRVFYDPRVEAIHLEGYTRGANPKEKEQKGTWDKEARSRPYFLKNIQCYNLYEVQKLVEEANARMPQIAAKPASEQSEVKKKRILVKRRGALGDVILTTPIVRELRRRSPDAHIIVSTDVPPVFVQNSYVDEVIHHGDMEHKLIACDNLYDLNLAYENNPKTHIIDAYAARVFGSTQIDKTTQLFFGRHEVDTVQKFMVRHAIDPAKLLVVHPAVTWKNRTWSHQNWMALLTRLSSIWQIVVVGSQGDYKSGGTISRVYDAHGEFSIQDIACLVSIAKAFIGVDSGLLHVAGTTKTPIVGIFTAVNPEWRKPLRPGLKNHGFVAVEPTIACKGCLHEITPPVTYCDCKRQDFACLSEITPEMVVRGLNQALAG